MINSDLFKKYENLKFEKPKTLFEVDLRVAYSHGVCPYCFNKLYPMNNRPLFYCKSKKHRNRFVISKNKMI